MKAIVYNKEKGGKSLKTGEVNKPVPKENEILVNVQASTLNTGDVARINMGFIPSKRPITGSEFSGIIEQVGKGLNGYEEGERVFGYINTGAHAEYITVTTKNVWSAIPANIDFYEAAAIPNGSLSALYFLHIAKAAEKKSVLIYGASGSVGAYAVQLAKNFGLHVTAVCSARNTKMVYSLGADVVLDYNNPEYENLSCKYDVVFDAVGKLDYKSSRKLLTDSGTFVTTQFNIQVLRTKLSSLFSSKRFVFGIARHKRKGLLYVANLIQAGKLKPVIDKIYQTEEVEMAHVRLLSGRKRGNIVLKMST